MREVAPGVTRRPSDTQEGRTGQPCRQGREAEAAVFRPGPERQQAPQGSRGEPPRPSETVLSLRNTCSAPRVSLSAASSGLFPQRRSISQAEARLQGVRMPRTRSLLLPFQAAPRLPGHPGPGHLRPNLQWHAETAAAIRTAAVSCLLGPQRRPVGQAGRARAAPGPRGEGMPWKRVA